MAAQGKVFKYGDNIDTDVIIPARYLNTPDAEELARHCMEDIDAGFIRNVRPGDIIVGGDNFGCGSSREHAPLAIQTCGVSCVIASTFARIFYRNAINIGLAIIESPEASAAIRAGDEVRVDFENGIVKDMTTGQSFRVAPFPPFLKKIIDAGGLLKAAAQEGISGEIPSSRGICESARAEDRISGEIPLSRGICESARAEDRT